MTTSVPIINRITGWIRRDCLKHGLSNDPDAYVEAEVNSWNPYRLLTEISQALEEEREETKK